MFGLSNSLLKTKRKSEDPASQFACVKQNMLTWAFFIIDVQTRNFLDTLFLHDPYKFKYCIRSQ